MKNLVRILKNLLKTGFSFISNQIIGNKIKEAEIVISQSDVILIESDIFIKSIQKIIESYYR